MPVKSNKVLPKKSKSGHEYIVFRLLPEDQKKAWQSQPKEMYTCMLFEEESIEDFCPYYHDYESFYDNWIEGRRAFHLD